MKPQGDPETRAFLRVEKKYNSLKGIPHCIGTTGEMEKEHLTGDQFCLKRKRRYQTKLITQTSSMFLSLEIDFEVLQHIFKATFLNPLSSGRQRQQKEQNSPDGKYSLLLERTKTMER